MISLRKYIVLYNLQNRKFQKTQVLYHCKLFKSTIKQFKISRELIYLQEKLCKKFKNVSARRIQILFRSEKYTINRFCNGHSKNGLCYNSKIVNKVL